MDDSELTWIYGRLGVARGCPEEAIAVNELASRENQLHPRSVDGSLKQLKQVAGCRLQVTVGFLEKVVHSDESLKNNVESAGFASGQ